MATRTRRCSISVRSTEDSWRGGLRDALWSVGHRIVAGGAERLASGQAADGEPVTADQSVAFDGFGGVVGARRVKPAGASEKWREKKLIASEQRQRHADADRQIGWAGRDDVRDCGGIRLQGQSGRRRAVRAWRPRQRRSHSRSCYDGKPLVSVV